MVDDHDELHHVSLNAPFLNDNNKISISEKNDNDENVIIINMKNLIFFIV